MLAALTQIPDWKELSLAELKRLIFGRGLMGPALTGKKKCSFRRYREGAHDFTAGEVILGEFMDGLTVLLRITRDTQKKPFDKLSRSECREDGFADADDAYEGMCEYYPDLKRSETVGIIRFEVLQHEGHPTVALNEHAG